MKINPILAADFYKVNHREQYPAGTELVYSNFTPRSVSHAKMSPHFDNKVVMFGLQGLLQWFFIDTWKREFFDKPKNVVVEAFRHRVDTALGPGTVTVDQVAALHNLGYLPLSIKALPEGARVNIKVPLLTVHNNNSDFFWLTNYIETALSAELWKPITVATIAHDFRRQLNHFVELTGSSPEFADWQCHDFSMRGMSGIYDAATCGAAHLLSNFGTDTIPAIDYLENYYGADARSEIIGGSVPATEHSVMCMGGQGGEVETFRRLIQDIYPSGIVSIVSDTWDFWRVITEYALVLKDEILARTPNALGQAKVVFRPDSGDPVDILCGTAFIDDLSEHSLETAKAIMEDRLRENVGEDTPHGECGDDDANGLFRHDGQVYQLEIAIEWNRHDKQFYYQDGSEITSCEPHTLTPAEKGAVECLWDIFGGTTTDKGFKTLDSHVGLIYGDSITIERQRHILQRLMDKGFSAGNVVFGIGSYTYQYITRDTFGMAMKATWGVVNGRERELFKDPATDTGAKKSAKGLLRVELEDGEYVLYDQQTREQESYGELNQVFSNGELTHFQTLAEIRQRLAAA